jgi:hypothetical protein
VSAAKKEKNRRRRRTIMSAYKKIECEIVDKDCLLEALSLLGFTPDVLSEPKSLKGYRGDERKEVAHIIISRNQINKFTGASNDIGFFWNETEQKYDFICSDYDKTKNMDQRIIQAYVKVAIEKALAKNGFKIKVNINDEEFLKRTMSEMEIVARKII